MAEDTPARTILVVDDDEGFRELVSGLLRGEGYEVATAGSGADALGWLSRRTPDLMLLDLKMQEVGGASLLRRLKRDALRVPFVVVTGQGDERVAVEVMKQGALDYVVKDTALLDLLPTVVQRSLTSIARERELAAARDRQRELEREILAIAEREQSRIGHDLHDGLGQQLTAIEMMCTGLREDVAGQPQIAAQVDRIRQFLRESIAHVRLLSRGLAPLTEAPDSLQIGLQELAQRLNSFGRLHVRLESPRPVHLPKGAGLHLYRIAQEALNNAVKHSHATDAVIRLGRDPEGVEMTVSDNGRGLQSSLARGIGMGIMRHRAGLIGATLTVESNRDRGVTIRCRLPSAG